MNDKKEEEWRLRLVEIYMAFLEVEKGLKKLNRLLHPEDNEKSNIKGDVKYSLDAAIAHFIIDYNRLPALELPDATKEMLQRVGEKVKRELEETEKLYEINPR